MAEEEAPSFVHAVDGRPKRDRALPKKYDPRSALPDPKSQPKQHTRGKRKTKVEDSIDEDPLAAAPESPEIAEVVSIDEARAFIWFDSNSAQSLDFPWPFDCIVDVRQKK